MIGPTHLQYSAPSPANRNEYSWLSFCFSLKMPTNPGPFLTQYSASLTTLFARAASSGGVVKRGGDSQGLKNWLVSPDISLWTAAQPYKAYILTRRSPNIGVLQKGDLEPFFDREALKSSGGHYSSAAIVVAVFSPKVGPQTDPSPGWSFVCCAGRVVAFAPRTGDHGRCALCRLLPFAAPALAG